MEFLPGWVKALISCAVMLLIAVQGIRLTSKGGSKKGSNSGSESTANSETKKE